MHVVPPQVWLNQRWLWPHIQSDTLQCLRVFAVPIAKGESVNNGLDYWTGLLDTPSISIVVHCTDHIENASHAQQDATSFPGMRISRMLNNRVMRLRTSAFVLWKYTCVTFITWHMEACWPTVIMQIRITDLTFNYFIYTRTYLWSNQNKLLASLTRAVSLLFW